MVSTGGSRYGGRLCAAPYYNCIKGDNCGHVHVEAKKGSKKGSKALVRGILKITQGPAGGSRAMAARNGAQG